MENDIKVEILLFSNVHLSYAYNAEFVKWFKETLQTNISKQEESTKKLRQSLLKELPAIYLS